MIKTAILVSACLLAANVRAAEPPPDPRDDSVASIRAAYPDLACLTVTPKDGKSWHEIPATAIAQLAAGHAVEVVLTDDEQDKQSCTCFLVKTPGGVLGWVWVPSSQFKADTLEVISWWGD